MRSKATVEESKDKTATINSPVPHPKTCYTGQDDTSPWDQIQPVFAYSDQLLIERPLPNEPASSRSRAVDNNFEHSDRLPIKKTRAVKKPVKKQSPNQLARRSPSVPGADYLSPHRALRLIPPPPFAVPTWPIVERIGILGLLVAAVASVSVLLVSYEESLHDSVLPPSPSLASRGEQLPSVHATALGVDDRAATAGDAVRVSSPGEIPTESQQSQRRASIAPEEPVLKVENTLRSAATEPMPPIPPARDAVPAATAVPIAVPPSAAPPRPSEPAVGLANDEMSRLIKRGQDFLNEGDFAAARLLFERAANTGSAEAALALGSTYDPSVIKQLGAVSVSPDIDRALKWYATAADRGSSDAADRYTDLMRAR
jgi:hypothetical protein